MQELSTVGSSETASDESMGATYKEKLNALINPEGSTEQICICDYGDMGEGKDFDWLWGDCLLKKLSRHLVVIWDGTNKINERHAGVLSRHLTPMDWALAFSIFLLREHNQDIPELSVHIVDVTGSFHEDIWSMQLRHSLLAQMPWVRLYAPLVPESKPGTIARHRGGYNPILSCEESDAPLLLETSGSKFRQAFRGTLGIQSGNLPGDLEKLVSLNKQWAAAVTQSYDHHDLNNLVGPAMFTKDTHSLGQLQRCLITRMKWCEDRLSKKLDLGDLIPSELKNGWEARFLLVDDHINEGWGRFLCELMGAASGKCLPPKSTQFERIDESADGGLEVHGSLTADPLFDFLTELDVAGFDERNYSRKLLMDQTSDRSEVIFLDLRLYETIDNERTFAEEWLCLAQKVNRLNKLAWPRFDDDELAGIGDWISKKDSGHEHQENAILLLPRLLALALPLTPIILFSATGKARMKEKLKSYGNIFTGFEKPRIVNDPRSLEESIAALGEALSVSKRMSDVRRRLETGQLAAAKMDNSLVRLVQPKTASNFHVEVYADEVGEKHFEEYADGAKQIKESITSGFAVRVFDDRYEERVLQEDFQKQHENTAEKEVAAVWARYLDKSGNKKGARLPKGSAILNYTREETVKKRVDALSNVLKEQVPWFVVATRVELENRGITSDLSLATYRETSLNKALRHNTEFALYVLIPYILGDPQSGFNGSVSMHFATRVIDLGDRSFGKTVARSFSLRHPTRLEIEIKGRRKIKIWTPIENKVRTYDEGSAFHLVGSWLSSWPTEKSVADQCIKEVTTTNLTNGTEYGITEEQASERRLVHDIADWVCSAVNNWNSSLRKILSEKIIPNGNWLVSGFGDNGCHRGKDWSKDTQNALKLMDSLRNSNEIAALRKLLEVPYIKECNPRLLTHDFCAQHRMILWRLHHQFAKEANGDTLRAIWSQ